MAGLLFDKKGDIIRMVREVKLDEVGDIFKMDLLSGGEYVGYPIGSFWLKILQRTWKNKYKLLVKRKKFNYLKQREICGF